MDEITSCFLSHLHTLCVLHCIHDDDDMDDDEKEMFIEPVNLSVLRDKIGSLFVLLFPYF